MSDEEETFTSAEETPADALALSERGWFIDALNPNRPFITFDGKPVSHITKAEVVLDAETQGVRARMTVVDSAFQALLPEVKVVSEAVADQEYVYEAKVVRVIDGDSVYLELTKEFTQVVDFGFRIKETITTKKSTTMNFRLIGINTPEIRGVPEDVKLKGLEAKQYLIALLDMGPITAVTYKPDKYGRWLVDLYVEAGEPYGRLHVNEEMINKGLAVRYTP